MAAKDKASDETPNSSVETVLGFDDLVGLGYTTTRNGSHQGDLADYCGEVVTILGLYQSNRKNARTVLEIESSDGIANRVRAPQYIVDGLERAFAQRPGVAFRVFVQDKGKGTKKRHVGLAAAN